MLIVHVSPYHTLNWGIWLSRKSWVWSYRIIEWFFCVTTQRGLTLHLLLFHLLSGKYCSLLIEVIPKEWVSEQDSSCIWSQTFNALRRQLEPSGFSSAIHWTAMATFSTVQGTRDSCHFLTLLLYTTMLKLGEKLPIPIQILKSTKTITVWECVVCSRVD